MTELRPSHAMWHCPNPGGHPNPHLLDKDEQLSEAAASAAMVIPEEDCESDDSSD